jgi:hypothetical protein
MREIVVAGLVGLTSAGVYLIAVGWLGLPRRQLRAALERALDVTGMSALFFVLNLALGALAILAVRNLTTTFVSLYLLSDVSLLLLSAVQGLVFECWRRESASAARSVADRHA